MNWLKHDLSCNPRVEILHGKNILDIIQGKQSQRISIPLEVTSIIHVHKIFKFIINKMLFDKDGFISRVTKVILTTNELLWYDS